MQEQNDELPEYSLNFLEMAFRTNRQIVPDRADGCAEKSTGCGDTVKMYLTLSGRTVQSVRFEIRGCLNTNACANAVAELAEGKTVEDARRLTAFDVARILETLPPEHMHCAELAIDAFQQALSGTGRA
jgi:nitrogen fixation NifU-like protein